MTICCGGWRTWRRRIRRRSRRILPQRVGGRTLTEFQQVTHAVPLESLQDVFDDEEVCRFLEKIPLEHPAYSVEPKVDGLSVALEYRDGVFVRGATRGDGRVGRT